MTDTQAHDESHGNGLGARLNWLRAAVLGANDGVVSTAGIVVGVAGATGDRGALLTAGLAGLLAGSLSMAAGEYVSVSTQRDSEQAALATERRELQETPEAELAELAGLLEGKGLSREVAREAALQLTERDALRAHAEVELGIDPDDLTNPWHAARRRLPGFHGGSAAAAAGDRAALVVAEAGHHGTGGTGGAGAHRVVERAAGRRGGGACGAAEHGRGAVAMGVTYAAGALLGAVGV